MLMLFLASIGGCSSLASGRPAGIQEYGEYPRNYFEIVRSHYRGLVGSQESIYFNIIHLPVAFAIGEASGSARYGYLVCADLNYKASNGEYTGHHTDGLLIHNGQVVQFLERAQWQGKHLC